MTRDEGRWWEIHGVESAEVEGDIKDLHRLDIPLKCKMLDQDDKCKLYDSPLRPKMCLDFDCDDPKYGFTRKG